jgi:hypothetical protein
MSGRRSADQPNDASIPAINSADYVNISDYFASFAAHQSIIELNTVRHRAISIANFIIAGCQRKSLPMTRTTRQSVVCLLIVGMLLPYQHATFAATADDASATSNQQPLDLALAADGVLQGQLVDGNGAALAQRNVAIWSNGHQVAQAATQGDGTFCVRGLRGGAHVLTTDHVGTVCRFWSEGTAPPSAAQKVLVIDDATVARGQTMLKPKSGWYSFFMTRPLLTVGVVATAIAVPVGIAANSGRNKSGS